MSRLADAIQNRTAVVGVIGLGYVGLPLAVAFAKAGFKVIGVDVDARKVDKLQSGDSYILDVPAADVEAIVGAGKFVATTDFGLLREVDAVSICVPTPLRKTKDPDISYITSSVAELKKVMHQGMLITLESTTYPGTTDELIGVELEQMGYRVGWDYHLCFSPERIDPSNPKYGIFNTPKVIGGYTSECTSLGAALYATVVEKVVPVSSTRVAEMAKLLENTFRAVNIGLVNEMALLCDRMGINVWEAIDAASTKPFGFMPFYPGPGIGGHCIPLDPLYLSWKAKTYEFFNKFIELASDINANMPRYVIERVSEALNGHRKCIAGSRILLLGMAYKKDVDDLRESPALEVFTFLRDRGADVTFCDPHVTSVRMPWGVVEGQPMSAELLASQDIVILTTNHSQFDYNLICEHAPLIFDTRNAFKGIEMEKIVRLGAPRNVQSVFSH